MVPVFPVLPSPISNYIAMKYSGGDAAENGIGAVK
jgi:hypothetical protein